MTLKVRDRLWVVANRLVSGAAGTGEDATVTTVGREWVTIALTHGRQLRFRKSDPEMRLDGAGYSSPGRCYASEEAYTAEKEAQGKWERILAFAGERKHTPPAGVDLDAVAKLLGIPGA